MTREFEGKTEKEAIDNAVAELGLERDEFDIEVVDTQKTGFLNLKKSVKIRVHLTDKFTAVHNSEPENDFEHGIIDFVRTVTDMMGFPATSKIIYREPGKIGIRLDSQHSGILIGRKGKNLDALQLLVNVVAGRLDGSTKVVIDSENYRSRREEQLIRMAQKVGDEVKRSRSSRLLEPMNPFERRLIHKTLNDIEDIATKSEGEGLYKQVRIYYKGVGQT